MIVIFAASVDAELREIEAHIALDDPAAAERVVDDLVATCMALEHASERGTHIADRRGVKIRRLVRAPYLIVYSVSAETVRIHRVVHGARSPALLLKGIDLT